jgi:hypothetical protein
MKNVKLTMMIAVIAILDKKVTVCGIELPQTPNTDLAIIDVDNPLRLPAIAATAINVPEAKYPVTSASKIAVALSPIPTKAQTKRTGTIVAETPSHPKS